MDLNLTRAFVAIYEAQSITTAADRLFVSQSALSQSLAKLRTSLNDTLFYRQNRLMLPTQRAAEVYPVFRDALAAIDKAMGRHAIFDPQTSDRTFTLALTELGEVGWLANIFREVREKAPHIVINVVPMDRTRVAEQLRQGSIDVAIAPTGLHTPAQRTKVKRQHYVLVMSPQHPLAHKEIGIGAFTKLPRIVIPSDSGSQQIEDFHLSLPKSDAPTFTIQHFASIPSVLMAQPDLIAIVPESIAHEWSLNWGLVEKPLPLEMPPLELSIYQRSTSHDLDALEWLVSALLKAIMTRPAHFETLTGGHPAAKK